MFIHQNLDNMDGRHARRFGVENPITDFFDHTADVITAGNVFDHTTDVITTGNIFVYTTDVITTGNIFD